MEIISMHAAFMGAMQGKNEPDAMYQEKADAKLIREDHNAIANLPTKGYQVHWRPDEHMQRLGTNKGISTPGKMA